MKFENDFLNEDSDSHKYYMSVVKDLKTKKNNELASLIMECAKNSLLLQALSPKNYKDKKDNIITSYIEFYDEELISIVSKLCINEDITFSYEIIQEKNKNVNMTFSWSIEKAKAEVEKFKRVCIEDKSTESKIKL